MKAWCSHTIGVIQFAFKGFCSSLVTLQLFSLASLCYYIILIEAVVSVQPASFVPS